ncbi:MAG TPA: metallophosphoesterase [Lichenihabitans sp.]|jgi:hypothetical protein|nr:metallophosphoesterase [Lichenihabitans sp.]
MIPTHFRSVVLSTWQAAVAKRARPPDLASDTLARPPVAFDDPYIEAANHAAQAAQAPSADQGARLSHPLFTAAKAALDLGLALVDGDPDRVIAAKAAFMRFGHRDPFWLECITEFVEHTAVARHAAASYIKWRSLTDAILPPGTLPERCRIAVISDWGTGDARAQALIGNVAAQTPDIVIHLGDIYYACTSVEAEAFHANIRRGLAPGAPRIFTLCGNHDMYSGGAPYYALIGRLGQPSSYFCLRNRHWQILAADTGFNDFNPFRHKDDMTWVRDRDEGDTYSELDWHKDKLANAAGRRTILMTHHPLFSRNSTIAGRAVNDYLQAQFGDHLPDLALWLWGHEHTLAIYEPFGGLAKGRCIGASAVPVPAEADLTSPSPQLAGEVVPGLLKDGALALRPQSTGGLYRLGYALIDLDGEAGAARYIEFDPSTGEAASRHEEAI